MGSLPAGRADGGPGADDRAAGQRWLRSPRGEERRLDDLYARWKSGRPLRGHARDYSRAAHRVDSSGGITREWSRRALDSASARLIRSVGPTDASPSSEGATERESCVTTVVFCASAHVSKTPMSMRRQRL